MLRYATLLFSFSPSVMYFYLENSCYRIWNFILLFPLPLYVFLFVIFYISLCILSFLSLFPCQCFYMYYKRSKPLLCQVPLYTYTPLIVPFENQIYLFLNLIIVAIYFLSFSVMARSSLRMLQDMVLFLFLFFIKVFEWSLIYCSIVYHLIRSIDGTLLLNIYQS